MSQKKIVWEKWIDPLNSNVDEVEYPGYDLPSQENEDSTIEFLSVDENFEDKYEEHLNDDSESQKNMIYNPVRIVQTPQGFVTLTEHSFASKSFDFWTMHYNQDITEKIISEIEKCPGVESVNAITRYRARLGFNRILLQSGAFDLNEIRKSVELAVLKCDSNKALSYETKYSEMQEDTDLIGFSEDIKQKVKNQVLELQKNKFWAMYVFPNGSIEYIAEADTKSRLFEEKSLFFKRIENMIGGKALFSQE
jgi:hypothetical protein